MQAEVIESEGNFEQACRHGLSHGKLLSLRYLVPDIPWHALQATADSTARLRAWIQRLIRLALRAASAALQPLSTPQETGLGMWHTLHHRMQRLCVHPTGKPCCFARSQPPYDSSVDATHMYSYVWQK